MGGDFGPPVTVPAALEALKAHPSLHLILVGDRDEIQRELTHHRALTESSITIHHASQRVEMDESPSQALRSKKDSSMRIAIDLVKEEKANACVSAGNTGALMATARFVLKTLPGIDRPAIISAFPTKHGKGVRMLDLGANVDSTPENLFQFAVMGSLLASEIDQIKSPKVCLLNIGHEDIKGNELVKETARLLSQSNAVNYAGYIEGDALYDGDVDVIVCDGFVGNVALKASEGVATFFTESLKESFYRNMFTKLVGVFARPILKALIKRIDPDRYNGATFLGLRGIVIKSHGGARVKAFAHAIEEAMLQVEHNIPLRIGAEVERLLSLLPKDHS